MEPTSYSPLLDNGQPAISCFALSPAELLRRQERAHARATEKLRAEAGQATDDDLLGMAEAIARYVLWHEDFPSGLLLLVVDNQLFRLTADLPGELLEANGGQRLDFYDYGYVADLLRDWLTSRTLPGEVLMLRRALAWAEEQGRGLRNYAHE